MRLIDIVINGILSCTFMICLALGCNVSVPDMFALDSSRPEARTPEAWWIGSESAA